MRPQAVQRILVAIDPTHQPVDLRAELIDLGHLVAHELLEPTDVGIRIELCIHAHGS